MSLRPSLFVLLFFAYLLFLFFIAHSRVPNVNDHALTFDSWWYFIDRLRQGEIAFWNPYSLLGRINVQWNTLAVGTLTPFFLFSEFTLAKFKALFVFSSFGFAVGLYFSGRYLRYPKHLCLLVLLFFIGDHYVSENSAYPDFSSVLYFAPAMAVVLRDLLNNRFPQAKTWLVFSILMTLATLGTRVDCLLYGYSLLTLLFIFLSFHSRQMACSQLKFLLVSGGSIALSIVMTSWQFPFIIGASLDNARIVFGGSLNILKDQLFVHYLSISLLSHAPLIFGLGLLLLGALTYRKRIGPMVGLVLLAVIWFVLLRVEQMELYRQTVWQRAGKSFGNEFILVTQILATVAVMASLFWRRYRVGFSILCQAVGASFVGIQILNFFFEVAMFNNLWRFFVYPFYAVFICGLVFGAASFAVRRKKVGLIVGLAFFLWFGQTGVFFLNELVGIPWQPNRAMMFAIGLLLILSLEGLLVVQKILRISLKRRGSKCTRIFRYTILVFALLCVDRYVIPREGDYFRATGLSQRTLVSETLENAFSKPAFFGSYLYYAYENSLLVKGSGIEQDHMKRASFYRILEDSGKNLLNARDKFFPAFVGLRNNVAHYSSEVPKNLSDIFFEHYNRTLPYHPEYDVNNQIYAAYKKKVIEREKWKVNYSYPMTVYINPKDLHPRYSKEILALGRTPRAFMSDQLRPYDDVMSQYNDLVHWTTKGRSLASLGMVTSDPKAQVQGLTKGDDEFEYVLSFVRDDPEHIVIDVESNRPGYLTLLDLYNPGWSALVDGAQADVMKVFLGARLIQVPAGTNRVEFIYRLPGFKVASAFSIFGWILVLVLLTKKNSPKSKPITLRANAFSK